MSVVTVQSDIVWDILILDYLARDLLGADTYGVSVGDVSSIHVTPDGVVMAGQILDGYNKLGVTVPAVGNIGDVLTINGASFILSSDDQGVLMAGNDSIVLPASGVFTLVWFNSEGLSSHGSIDVL